MNKVILLGRLTKDPDISYTQGATPTMVASYTLAVSRRFKRENEADADFINCKSFGKAAEFIQRYISKGRQVAVCGRLQIREYTDNTGQRKWWTEVITDEVSFADSKPSQDGQGGYGQTNPYDGSSGKAPSGPPSYEPPEGFSAITQSIDDDDLPF